MLRADVSGWPFTGEVTWFTVSLLVYPALLAGLLLYRSRPWVRVALAAALLVAVQGPHMFWETPVGFERYFDRIAAQVSGAELPAEATKPIPEVTTLGPRPASSPDRAIRRAGAGGDEGQGWSQPGSQRPSQGPTLVDGS